MGKYIELLGASVVLAIVASLLYMSGSFMIVSKYSILGVPSSLISTDLYQIFVAGRGPLLIFILLVVIILMADRSLRRLEVYLKNRNHKLAKFIPLMSDSQGVVDWLGRGLFLVAIYYIALHFCMQYQAKHIAMQIATRDFPRVNFSQAVAF